MSTRSTLKKLGFTILFLILLAHLGGCATWNNSSTQHQSSLVQYLYPDLEKPLIDAGPTRLKLPIRLGIALVPGDWPSGFSAQEERQLLESVRARFVDRPDIEHIELIPQSYLQRNGGFANLQQISAMHRIEVIALISLDQMQHSDSTAASILVWTIVGAAFLPTEVNTTSTMLDTAVIDIQSRRLLFRAPGTSKNKGLSTDNGTQASLRRLRNDGIAKASVPMLNNLDSALAAFRADLKANQLDIAVVNKPGYTGAGSMSLGIVFLLFAAIAIARKPLDRLPT